MYICTCTLYHLRKVKVIIYKHGICSIYSIIMNISQYNVLSPDCGDSPDFANFRRPKPLQFRDNSDDSARIINGEVTSRDSWPWQVWHNTNDKVTRKCWEVFFRFSHGDDVTVNIIKLPQNTIINLLFVTNWVIRQANLQLSSARSPYSWRIPSSAPSATGAGPSSWRSTGWWPRPTV